MKPTMNADSIERSSIFESSPFVYGEHSYNKLCSDYTVDTEESDSLDKPCFTNESVLLIKKEYDSLIQDCHEEESDIHENNTRETPAPSNSSSCSTFVLNDINQEKSSMMAVAGFSNIKVKSEPIWDFGETTVKNCSISGDDIGGRPDDRGNVKRDHLNDEQTNHTDESDTNTKIVSKPESYSLARSGNSNTNGFSAHSLSELCSLKNTNDHMVLSITSELGNFMEHDNLEFSSVMQDDSGNDSLCTSHLSSTSSNISYHATSIPHVGIIKSEPVWDDSPSDIHHGTIFEKQYVEEVGCNKSDEFLDGMGNSDEEFSSHLMLNASTDPEWNSNMCTDLKSSNKDEGKSSEVGIAGNSPKVNTLFENSRKGKNSRTQNLSESRATKRRKLDPAKSSNVEVKQKVNRRCKNAKRSQKGIGGTHSADKEQDAMKGTGIKIKSEPDWNDDLEDWSVDKSDILESTVGGFQEEEGVNFNQFDFNSNQFDNECAYPGAVFMNSAVATESSLAKDMCSQEEETNTSHQNIKIISVVDRKQSDDASSVEQGKDSGESPDYVLNASNVGDNVLQINIYKVQTPADQDTNKWSVKKEDNKFVKKDVSERMFECRECSEKFFEANELLTHFKIHEGRKADDAQKWSYPYICKKCDKGYTSSKGLLMHYQTHQCLNSSVEGETEEKKWNTLWECPYCTGEKFSSFLLLCQHMTCHRFNYCQFCKISFSNSIALQEHYQVKHNTRMSAIPASDKAPTKSNFPRKDVHSINAYKCQHCQCLFINANALLKHEKKHLKNPQPAQHQCSICKRVFTNKCHLTSHIHHDHKLKNSKKLSSDQSPSLQSPAASTVSSDDHELDDSEMPGHDTVEEPLGSEIKTEPLDMDEYCDSNGIEQNLSENADFSTSSSRISAKYFDSSGTLSTSTPETVMFIATKTPVTTDAPSVVIENVSETCKIRPSISEIVNTSISTVKSTTRGSGSRRRDRKIFTCPICQKVFHLKSLFTTHLERHKFLAVNS